MATVLFSVTRHRVVRLRAATKIGQPTILPAVLDGGAAATPAAPALNGGSALTATFDQVVSGGTA